MRMLKAGHHTEADFPTIQGCAWWAGLDPEHTPCGLPQAHQHRRLQRLVLQVSYAHCVGDALLEKGLCHRVVSQDYNASKSTGMPASFHRSLLENRFRETVAVLKMALKAHSSHASCLLCSGFLQPPSGSSSRSGACQPCHGPPLRPAGKHRASSGARTVRGA